MTAATCHAEQEDFRQHHQTPQPFTRTAVCEHGGRHAQVLSVLVGRAVSAAGELLPNLWDAAMSALNNPAHFAEEDQKLTLGRVRPAQAHPTSIRSSGLDRAISPKSPKPWATGAGGASGQMRRRAAAGQRGVFVSRRFQEGDQPA